MFKHQVKNHLARIPDAKDVLNFASNINLAFGPIRPGTTVTAQEQFICVAKVPTVTALRELGRAFGGDKRPISRSGIRVEGYFMHVSLYYQNVEREREIQQAPDAGHCLDAIRYANLGIPSRYLNSSRKVKPKPVAIHALPESPKRKIKL